ncbi:MAG TPA: MarR family transcriptional regulator [Candidatus Limnocylindrales bacterium]
MTDTLTDPLWSPASTAGGGGRERPPRLSAGLTRGRLLALLRDADEPLSVGELAAALRLHRNSVRQQLDRLVAAGLAARAPSRPTGRGRPALRYRARLEVDTAAPYRELALALARELGGLPASTSLAVAAGERWGETAVGQAEWPVDGSGDAVARLLALLDAAGFAPEPVHEGEPVRLRRCPFLPLVDREPAVVCAVHLGLMRGALAALDAPVDVVRLDPLVAPDLCLTHLGRRDGPAPS